jgi:hypothetical protein
MQDGSYELIPTAHGGRADARRGKRDTGQSEDQPRSASTPAGPRYISRLSRVRPTVGGPPLALMRLEHLRVGFLDRDPTR